MRIVHVIPSLSAGGAERQVVLLASAQARAGDIVAIVINKNIDESNKTHHYNIDRLSPSVQLVELIDYRRDCIRYVSELRAFLHQFRPHIVQGWLPQTGALSRMAAHMAGISHIYAERNNKRAYSILFKNSPLKAIAASLTARTASAIVANSLDGAELWKQTQKLQGRVHFVPNCIPDEVYQRPEWGQVIQAPSRMLIVGRLAPQKRPELCLEAFALVAARHDISLEIIGEGPLAAALSQLAVRLNIQDRVTFSGLVADWWRSRRCKSIFVTMSEFEGQPNTLLESMAAGIPIVASDIRAHRDLLGARGALLVLETSPEAVAAAIEQLLTDSNQRAMRAIEAFEMAAQYTVERTRELYASIYAKIVARGG